MAGSGVSDDRREWDQFIRGLRQLQRGPKSVTTGVQNGSRSADGVDVATYATINEMGTTIRRTGKNGPVRPTVIPSRPFMRLYFDKNLEKIGRFSENAIMQVMLGRANIRQSYTAIGLYVQDGIREQIKRSGDYAPNAPMTIRLKGSDKPLIDHAILLANITFQIRND